MQNLKNKQVTQRSSLRKKEERKEYQFNKAWQKTVIFSISKKEKKWMGIPQV